MVRLQLEPPNDLSHDVDATAERDILSFAGCSVDLADKGLLPRVLTVSEGSGAHNMGVQCNDVLVAVDDQHTEGMVRDDVISAIGAASSLEFACQTDGSDACSAPDSPKNVSGAADGSSDGTGHGEDVPADAASAAGAPDVMQGASAAGAPDVMQVGSAAGAPDVRDASVGCSGACSGAAGDNDKDMASKSPASSPASSEVSAVTSNTRRARVSGIVGFACNETYVEDSPDSGTFSLESRSSSASRDDGVTHSLKLYKDSDGASCAEILQDQLEGNIHVVTLAGFSREKMNVQYRERRDVDHLVSGFPTYWATNQDFLLYWDVRHGSWRCGLAVQFSKLQAGDSYAVAEAPKSCSELRGPTKGWHEWSEKTLKWVHRPHAGISSVSSMGPRGARTIALCTAGEGWRVATKSAKKTAAQWRAATDAVLTLQEPGSTEWHIHPEHLQVSRNGSLSTQEPLDLLGAASPSRASSGQVVGKQKGHMDADRNMEELIRLEEEEDAKKREKQKLKKEEDAKRKADAKRKKEEEKEEVARQREAEEEARRLDQVEKASERKRKKEAERLQKEEEDTVRRAEENKRKAEKAEKKRKEDEEKSKRREEEEREAAKVREAEEIKRKEEEAKQDLRRRRREAEEKQRIEASAKLRREQEEKDESKRQEQEERRRQQEQESKAARQREAEERARREELEKVRIRAEAESRRMLAQEAAVLQVLEPQIHDQRQCAEDLEAVDSWEQMVDEERRKEVDAQMSLESVVRCVMDDDESNDNDGAWCQPRSDGLASEHRLFTAAEDFELPVEGYLKVLKNEGLVVLFWQGGDEWEAGGWCYGYVKGCQRQESGGLPLPQRRGWFPQRIVCQGEKPSIWRSEAV